MVGFVRVGHFFYTQMSFIIFRVLHNTEFLQICYDSYLFILKELKVDISEMSAF